MPLSLHVRFLVRNVLLCGMAKRVAILFAGALFLWQTSAGQSTDWKIKAEATIEKWPVAIGKPTRENDSWKKDIVLHFQNEGFFTPRVDSVSWTNRVVYATLGPIQTIHEINVDILGSALDTSKIPTPVGQAFTARAIGGYMGQILRWATDNGYLGAQGRIVEVDRVDQGWNVHIVIETGLLFTLDSIFLDGDDKTKARFVQQLVGLDLGVPLTGLMLDASRKALLGSGLYDGVGDATFERVSDSTATMVIPVQLRSAGSFDLSAGFIPPSGSGSSQLVGNGHIQLLNPFGSGRTFGAQIERYPNQSSGVAVSFRDPRFWSWPISWGGSFEGYQQDSTFSSLGYAFGVGLLLRNDLRVGIQWNGQRSKPLQAGGRIENGFQKIGRSSGQFVGIETTLSMLDDVNYPRKGLLAEILVESGRRDNKKDRVVGPDTSTVVSSQKEEKMRYAVTGYIPLNSRLNLVVGANGKLTSLKRPDLGEVIRFGGANSLRGYDENQFQATFATRLFSELRWYSDQITYGYLFYDAGLIKKAPLDQSSSKIMLFPGYGLGISFSSRMGPIRVSYAVNNQDGWKDGRLHVSVSFGL